MSTENLSDIVRRVPIFQGLDVSQFESTLSVCQKCTFEEGHIIFEEGDQSTNLFIILSGAFQVRSSTGSEIAVISEMGVVGEMGVLTEQPRSANVIAYRPAEALRITKEDLFGLIEHDRDMGVKIYRNVTHILSDRLRDNNIVLEQQYLILEDLTGDDAQT